ALHQRLLEAHHHELARASTAGSPTDRSGAAPAAPAAVPTSPSLAPSASALSVSHSASKKHVNSKKSVILNLPAAAAENVTHEKSEKSVSIALGPAGDSASPRSVESHVESRVRSVQSGLSEESLSPRSTRVSSRLMKQAREVAVNIEHQVDEDSLHGALRLRDEWAMSEEKLKELKRIQRRMSIGSRRSLKSAVKRQYLVRTEREDVPCYVLCPNSWRRICWDFLTCIFILFEISISPLQLYRMGELLRNTTDLLQWISTSFWLLDIVVSFFSAVYLNETLLYRLRDIAFHYLRSWFFFDVAMLIPDLIVVFLPNFNDGPASVVRIVRFRRLVRLIRFLQLIRLWNVVQSYASLEYRMTFLKTKFGSLIQPVLTVTVIIGLSVHVLGSLWYYVGDVDGGWVLKEGLHEVSIARQYTRSMEWALSKLPPSALRVSVELHTPAERWLGIFGTGMALLCGSIFVSFLTNTMADVARERTRTTKIMQSVRKYCSMHGISYRHTMQMRRYVEHEHRRKEMNSHMPLLEDLPEGMVRELFQEGRTQTLHNHAFFMEIGLADSAMELNLCSHAVSELYLLAGDIIFDTTSKTEGMYLIGAGNSIYFYWSESTKMSARRSRRTETTGSIFQSIMTLGTSGPTNTNQRDRSSTMLMAQTMIQAGEYCAEPALWVKAWRHQGQLQSVVESRALLVSTCELFKVLEHYANSLANTIVYARCFVEELNKTADLCKQVTDLPLTPLDEERRRPHRATSVRSLFSQSKVYPRG
ncbi:Potassium/sodium hyperpolarization-activated cyclic nucleotide-gated channel 4 (Hyperpolarization-activated cation channel 4) (HAC-4), partial [Durusdinium trenchii]